MAFQVLKIHENSAASDFANQEEETAKNFANFFPSSGSSWQRFFLPWWVLGRYKTEIYLGKNIKYDVNEGWGQEQCDQIKIAKCL